MKLQRDPADILVQRTTRLILLLAALVSGMATILHRLEPAPHLMDLIIPPVGCVLYSALLITLYRSPQRLPLVIKVAYVVTVLALAIPSWLCTIEALDNPALKLIDLYPPITSLVFAVFLIAMIFFTPRHALVVSSVSWLLIAAPVLFYLIQHPTELWSPRGKDMFIALGPALLLPLILVPFYREMQGRIRALDEKHQYMQSLADQDSLTQLPNRRPTQRLLGDILTKQQNAGLLLFDIDHFKQINDTYGHTAGDEVLKIIAKRCSNVLRKDGYIARWGGEEFLIILENVTRQDMISVGERLRQAISRETIMPAGIVTASFGASLVADNDSETTLLSRVDKALYQAKSKGRNCLVYN